LPWAFIYRAVGALLPTFDAKPTIHVKVCLGILRAKFSADLATEQQQMKLTRDIQSLSTFKRDTAKIVRQLKKTGQPVVLTVNGKAELVVQDAESYQKLLEMQDRMEAIEGIKRGFESMKRKRG
jgi:prevent-host-death family protein